MHPSPPSLPFVHQPANPHFERIGGEAGIRRLVEAFYRAMDAREDARVIRAMHEPDLASTRAVLVKYLSEWMGGARSYSAERGPPALRRRHLHFALDVSARDAWMACMRQALAETCPDTALIAELDAAFWKIADHLRNT
jgi:hemoglobin